MVQRRSFCHAMGLLLYDIAWFLGFCIAFAVMQVLGFHALGGVMYAIFWTFGLPIKSFTHMMAYGFGTLFAVSIPIGIIYMLAKTYEMRARGY